MTNDFSTISAESNLRDQIVLTPDEVMEANAWFDRREEETEDGWLDAMHEALGEFWYYIITT